MENTFSNELKEIIMEHPSRAVKQVFRFLGISEDMGLEDLVATKHTLDLFRSSAKVDLVATKILDHLDIVLTDTLRPHTRRKARRA
ncbi:MAG: hypothetical protein WD897_02220 [Parcubacteria group bacterium]